MSNDLKKETIQELETIIRLLADVWPTDRENLAEAGARFEKVIGGMDQNFGQLQKLINLSWEGLKHLYEKDDFFMTVKASTMQAVNTVREYIIEDGDINVEKEPKILKNLLMISRSHFPADPNRLIRLLNWMKSRARKRRNRLLQKAAVMVKNRFPLMIWPHSS